MRRTLRRSCAACAKAKHKCDLQTPQCTRCTERKYNCIYANQPLAPAVVRRPEPPELSLTLSSGSIDPFDTYPATSLPRARVQGLIHHFLTKIAFQYYPWDLNPSTNPFIVSWWPSALADPPLFHVSLQTACLDDEFFNGRGFVHSDILMRDTVMLVRKRVGDPEMAFKDEMLDSVVTMAAIEHGKGNLEISSMHIDAVKRMVQVRGGISKVKQSSPLTARMVTWVSMLVMGFPQFQFQDDMKFRNGIAPIPQWEISPVQPHELGSLPTPLPLDEFDIDPTVKEVLIQLQAISHQYQINSQSSIPPILTIAEIHDLASFALHILLQHPQSEMPASISECIRYGLCIYMFILHGPTYYSHAAILNTLVLQLQHQIMALVSQKALCGEVQTWIYSMGLVGSIGTETHDWFLKQSAMVSNRLEIDSWELVKSQLESIVWLPNMMCEMVFRQTWETIITAPARTSPVGVKHEVDE